MSQARMLPSACAFKVVAIRFLRFGKLAVIARVDKALERESLSGSRLGPAWMVAQDFDINQRYPEHSGSGFPVRLGRDMVRAVGSDGLLQWLILP